MMLQSCKKLSRKKLLNVVQLVRRNFFMVYRYWALGLKPEKGRVSWEDNSLKFICFVISAKPESIEWFVDDQAFSTSYDLAPPPPPFSHQ